MGKVHNNVWYVRWRIFHSKIILQNARHWFFTTNLSRKESPWSGNTLSAKEKFQAQLTVKMGHAEVLRYERINHYSISGINWSCWMLFLFPESDSKMHLVYWWPTCEYLCVLVGWLVGWLGFMAYQPLPIN